VVPRAQLPAVLRQVYEIAARHELLVLNVFHAGDGNLHPLLVFDRREPGVLDRVHRAGEEIVRASVAAGGVLSGEHGIGLEKRDLMPLMFGAVDLAAQAALRDAFDPAGLANPHKVLPSPAGCGDVHLVPEGAWI
jgi:glycolate oxidase